MTVHSVPLLPVLGTAMVYLQNLVLILLLRLKLWRFYVLPLISTIYAAVSIKSLSATVWTIPLLLLKTLESVVQLQYC